MMLEHNISSELVLQKKKKVKPVYPTTKSWRHRGQENMLKDTIEAQQAKSGLWEALQDKPLKSSTNKLEVEKTDQENLQIKRNLGVPGWFSS